MYDKRLDSYCLYWAKKIKAIRILGSKCQMCGIDDIFSLMFHHSDGAEKETTINEIITCNWLDIETEIKKMYVIML